MLTYKIVDIMVQPITNLLRKFALSPPQKKKKNREPFENIKINMTAFDSFSDIQTQLWNTFLLCKNLTLKH